MAGEEMMPQALDERVIDGRYRLIREIARGGAGTVFEACHEFVGRTVAIKVLNQEHRHDVESQTRLLLEAKALFLARHPNVVEILDAGISQTGEAYVAMELLEGRSLGGLLAARGVLSPAETLDLGRQVLEALGALHANDLVHRDIKPDNLIVRTQSDRSWKVILLDFGTARIGSSNVKLTRTGGVLGTPEYMAPEQLMEEPTDHRADIYALGVTLFEALTGRVPFPGTFGQVLMALNSGTRPEIRKLCPQVPEALAAAIETATERLPGQRFPDVARFLAALSAVDAAAVGPAARDTGQARAFNRAPYITPVRIVQPDSSHTDGRSEDISEGGLLVLVDRDLPTDGRVSVRFALPVSGQMVDLPAVVKWRRGQKTRATGLEFIDLPEAAAASVRLYVKLMAPTR